jgi:predicted transcriptional regulator
MVSSSFPSFCSSKLVAESAMEIQQKILSYNNRSNQSLLLVPPPPARQPLRHQHNRRQQSYRQSHDIIKQILQAVHSRTRKGYYCRPLQVVYSCQITWSQFRHYRELLLRHKLLVSSDTKPFMHYKITDKGIHYMQLFDEIEDDLKPVSH